MMMDIFDFALKMESDGEKYYRDLAEKVSLSELKYVLEGLAEDEQRHHKIIQSLQRQTANFVEADPALQKTGHVFAGGKYKGSVLDNKELFIAKLKGQQLDVYQAALTKEKESVELYGKLGENAKGREEKIICEKLRREEEKHVEVIEDIIDMLNHVHDWVDAPEFNHQDVY
jgi:rubrerythrin